MKWFSPLSFSLLAFIPFLLLLFWWNQKNLAKILKTWIDPSVMNKILWAPQSITPRFKFYALSIALVFLIFGLARPQWGGEWVEIEKKGIDLYLIIDVSKSMLSQDVTPSRLERAKRKISDLTNLLEGDRIGLIAFSGSAYLLSPLTLDYGILHLYLEQLSPSLISSSGTDLEEALSLALNSLEKNGAKKGALLLMTDGEDLEGNFQSKVDEAHDKGITIYTLGMGTPQGGPIPDTNGSLKKDDQGNLVITKLNESLLKNIANKTNGLYLTLTPGDDDLKSFVSHLHSQVDAQEIHKGKRRLYKEGFQWFLFIALFFVSLEFLAPYFKGRVAKLMVLLGLGLLGTYPLQADETVNPSLLYNQGAQLYEKKQYPQAHQAFDQTLKQDIPQSLRFKTLYNQGNTYYREGKLEEAVKSYDEALKLNPSDQETLDNLKLTKEKLEKQKQEKEQDKDKNQDKEQKDKNQENKNQEGQQKTSPETQNQSSPPQNPKDNKDQKQDPNKDDKKNQQAENQPESKPSETSEKKDDEKPAELPAEGKKNNVKLAPGQLSPQEAEQLISIVPEGKNRIQKQKKGKKSSSGKDW